ncbi:hypothetical protein PSECIP111951_01070 [Pseudoalteromonas holothuriae]|uniref:Phage shock protein B n=1 Tax=Pseudoalteromonas holothuriae TaxID=2963714 RepID=A0A9W4QX59_9GAMM|nr:MULTISPECIES: hypothetical protein [unclassified Pseudoalteromonas]CAH9054593.1 hypothetical protein PSECIP111951_01070 [Pseudoalteromonas sp. CIP111951]CAH9057286.1 hypothetical protein PSECIP111854_01966 [Pseudoalteromonas sp. CIP111854]
MSGTTMIVLIVFITVGFSIISKMFNRYLSHQKSQHSKHNEALNAELRALKERVATLEKIVTDDGYVLKEQFKNL